MEGRRAAPEAVHADVFQGPGLTSIPQVTSPWRSDNVGAPSRGESVIELGHAVQVLGGQAGAKPQASR